MSKGPRNITRRKWSFLIPQIAIFLLIALIFRELEIPKYWLLSFAIYALLGGYLKVLIPKYHRKGLYYLKKGELEGAAYAFETSYLFFTKHQWLDKYRAYFMFSISFYSYREMALMNAIYCHEKRGDKKKAKELQKRLGAQFPNNPYGS